MRRVLCLCPLFVTAWPLCAAENDEALVARLEAARDSREQHEVLDEIAERIAETPLSTRLTERLTAELMSEETYNYHHIMRALPQLAGEQGFSEPSLVHLAAGLSGSITRHYDASRGIARALSTAHGSSGLPGEAFSEVIAAVDHVAMLNRSAAIEVLAATRRDDPRFEAAMLALVHALENEHEHTRSSAVQAIGRVSRGSQLPDEALSGVVRAATDDPYMTVRMDALELLASKNVAAELKATLSESLAKEIVSPDHELWARSRGLRDHDSLGDRVTAVLAGLHEAPYPGHVIDAWIAQTANPEPLKSLDALAGVTARGELTTEQRAALLQIAESHRMPADREAIYALLFVEMQAGTLMDTLIALEHAQDEHGRIRAGYALKEQYRSTNVPDRVAAVAARVALTGSNDELRGIAAGLLSASEWDTGERERRLVAAMNAHPDDFGIQNAVVSLYGPEHLEKLVIQYAADPAMSVTFRRHIVYLLEQQGTEGAELSRGAMNTLEAVARRSDDYRLVQNAGKALKVFGLRPPMRVAIQNRNNQSMALFAILVTLAIVNAVAAVLALVSIFRWPLKSAEPGKRVAMRFGMVAALVVLSAGMLVLLGAGLIGFLGHNSLPSPKATLVWNIPAYAGTIVYLTLVVLFIRRVKSARQAT
jgi:hypothetical protein